MLQLIFVIVRSLANTWEEKDYTEWAKTKLAEVFGEEISLDYSGGFDITLKKGENLSGSAQKAHVRGKARFIYEFSFDLPFKIKGNEDSNIYKGKLCISDAINDQLDDIDIELKWTAGKAPPNSTMKAYKDALFKGKELKKAIISKLKAFEDEFSKL